MLGLLRPYRRQYAIGAALGLVHIVLEMLSPRFTQEIIDHCSAWLAGASGTGAAEGSGFIARTAAGVVAGLGFGGPLSTERSAVATVAAIVGLWAVVIAASVVLQRLTILVMTGAGRARAVHASAGGSSPTCRSCR